MLGNPRPVDFKATPTSHQFWFFLQDELLPVRQTQARLTVKRNVGLFPCKNKQKQEDDAGYHSRQVDELAAFQTEDHSQEKHQQEPAVINDAKVS